VPALFWLEVQNGLLMAERRKRLTTSDSGIFNELLSGLQLTTDYSTPDRAGSQIRDLAITHGLTIYDAAYLELAIRENLEIATLDEQLRAAAAAADVTLV
jgi:predicted nucleic acid-binding protein